DARYLFAGLAPTGVPDTFEPRASPGGTSALGVKLGPWETPIRPSKIASGGLGAASALAAARAVRFGLAGRICAAGRLSKYVSKLAVSIRVLLPSLTARTRPAPRTS